MSDSVSARDVLREIKDFYSLQLSKFNEYNEIEKARPMAFLSLWCVFEKAMKKIGELEKRRSLRENLCLWIEYLDGGLPKTPKEIKNFSVEFNSIPEIALIETYLGELPAIIKNVHNPKNKYRRARNDLAHKVEFISREETFNKYIDCIKRATDETIKLLEAKVKNDNK